MILIMYGYAYNKLSRNIYYFKGTSTKWSALAQKVNFWIDAYLIVILDIRKCMCIKNNSLLSVWIMVRYKVGRTMWCKLLVIGL